MKERLTSNTGLKIMKRLFNVDRMCVVQNFIKMRSSTTGATEQKTLKTCNTWCTTFWGVK